MLSICLGITLHIILYAYYKRYSIVVHLSFLSNDYHHDNIYQH